MRSVSLAESDIGTQTPVDSDRLAEAVTDIATHSALFISTEQDLGLLSHQQQAVRTLKRAIAAHHSGKAPTNHIWLVPDEPIDTSAIALSSGHERSWLNAGHLFERIQELAEEQKNPHAMVFTDSWVLAIAQYRSVLPKDLKLFYLSDLPCRFQSDHSEYWKELADWVNELDNIHVLDGSALIRAYGIPIILPENVHEIRSSIFKNPSTFVFLWEDTEDGTPDYAGLRELSSLLKDPLYELIIVSPHLSRIQREHPDLAKAATVSADTRNLSLQVYASLLRAADCYLKPPVPPFSEKLSESILTGIPKLSQVQGNLPEAIRGLRDSIPDSLAAQPSRMEQMSDQVQHGERRPFTFMPKPNTKNGKSSNRPIPMLEPSRPSVLPTITILTFCYKYLQRFRVFLNSVVRQSYPLEKIDVCVALPGNPDGIVEYLELFRLAHPNLRVTAVMAPESERVNRGKMINHAFADVSGQVVMVADCDLVLPPYFFQTVIKDFSPKHVLGCWRTPLDQTITAQIVTGNLDPIAIFDRLKDLWDPTEKKELREGILGYCQILTRTAFETVRYPDEFDKINQSDIVFLDRLRSKLGIESKMLEHLFVLHLAHPRDWSGTKVFL